MKVLLVEDHEDSLKAASLLLRRRGYHVDEATSIEEAIAHADTNGCYDLLLSDIGLPDGSGLLLPTLLKGRIRCAIALTGYGMPEDIEACTEAGFMGHLMKPYSIEVLQSAIEAIC